MIKKWVRRIACLLLSALLLAFSVTAAASSAYEYSTEAMDDGSMVYYFEDLSLRLPADWAGKVTVLRETGSVSFYQTASYEKYLEEGISNGGFLFALSASVNQSFTALPAWEFVGFSESSAMNYFLRLPSDYPAYTEPDIRAEYDAMYAEIGYIVENAYIYPAGDESDDSGTSTDGTTDSGSTTSTDTGGGTADTSGGTETTDTGNGEAQWTPAQVRYYFEHNMLPRYYYEVPDNMLNGLFGVGLYGLWESVATENGVDPYYPKADYTERWYNADDGTEMVIAELPHPDANALCYRIYFVYNSGTGYVGYFTVESETLLGESAFLCSWTKELEHVNYGGAEILDRHSSDYDDAIMREAKQVANLAGVSDNLTYYETRTWDDDDQDGSGTPSGGSAGGDGGNDGDGSDGGASGGADFDTSGLTTITCDEMGFSVMADPAYSWDYQEGTGISIYTDHADSIPYVIIYRSGDLLGDPYEVITEQYTPYIQERYGEDLAMYTEYETYEIGGKKLPAGLYTYHLQGYLIDLLRIFDSTGDHTVIYTAKYINGQGEATLEALDTAIRTYQPY